MKVSTKGRYALRILIDLAINAKDGYISIKSISERQKISIKYMETIVGMLNKGGFLNSLRGHSGGYKLSRPASNIVVGDVLRFIEGSLAPIPCLETEEILVNLLQCARLYLSGKVFILWLLIMWISSLLKI